MAAFLPPVVLMSLPPPLSSLGLDCAGEVQSVTLKSEWLVRLVCSSASSLKKKNSWHARHSYTLDSNIYMHLDDGGVGYKKKLVCSITYTQLCYCFCSMRPCFES